ncbi:sulfurtransferase FdhD [Polymorphobacter glacialis]|uniref:Sulfur carrier protein FdhD n=2 Tax=Sandarakinorhabdus glacialis TaxID=1614636 RepID=A0A916ZNC4_9SPHN|nr:sulfurtransferase FdhD [Polymorphobacter glacialis]
MVSSRACRPDGQQVTERCLPEECAVAIIHDGTTYAVLMASPTDLEDLAIGFSLTEGAIANMAAVAEFEMVGQADGIELRLWLRAGEGGAAGDRRRAIVGGSGCGLCGVESLAAAIHQVAKVTAGLRFSHGEIAAAAASLSGRQRLGDATRAVHAAGFWTRSEGLVAIREDVGRHNALDKLVGAMARMGRDGSGGIVVLTSRVSVEMVQKTARFGASVLVAISAPTALAVRTADAAGIALAAVARVDGFEIFCGAERIAQ